MINQAKYIVQGAALALLFIIVINTFSFSALNTNLRQNTVIDSSVHRSVVYTVTNTAGQKLFSEKCSPCHALFKRDGGQLFGIENRVKDKVLLCEWIRNSSKVLASGDSYFNAQVKEYGIRMTDFPELTDPQIDDILEYIYQAELVRYGTLR